MQVGMEIAEVESMGSPLGAGRRRGGWMWQSADEVPSLSAGHPLWISRRTAPGGRTGGWSDGGGQRHWQGGHKWCPREAEGARPGRGARGPTMRA